VLDKWLRASRANVLVAGDSGGISGAEAAQAAGRIAALQAATDLGALSATRRDELARASRRCLSVLAGVRRFLDRLYEPSARHRIPDGATIVCRCEDVTAGEAQAAIAEGCVGPDQLKFFTRCGMGPCQGRYCGLTITEMISQATGAPPEAVGYYRIRQPVKPLKLGVLATAAAPIEKAAVYKT
jgi:bacterioferritin-associated ferredoxin